MIGAGRALKWSPRGSSRASYRTTSRSKDTAPLFSMSSTSANLQADLALALAWDCRETLRPDLRILFMSATLPRGDIRAVFGDINLISVPGRTHPVRVVYRPAASRRKTVGRRGAADRRGEGDPCRRKPAAATSWCSCPVSGKFTAPGKPSAGTIRTSTPKLVALHGQLPARRTAQGARSRRRERRSSDNPAQQTWRKPASPFPASAPWWTPASSARVRYRPRTGMDHWDTVAISIASAEQRKGRAGRQGPGLCLRWWNETDTARNSPRRKYCESDLAPLVLETALWGAASPFDLKWLTPPPPGSVT